MDMAVMLAMASSREVASGQTDASWPSSSERSATANRASRPR